MDTRTMPPKSCLAGSDPINERSTYYRQILIHDSSTWSASRHLDFRMSRVYWSALMDDAFSGQFTDFLIQQAQLS